MSGGNSIIGNTDNLGRRRKQDTSTFCAISGGLNITTPVGGRANLSGGTEAVAPSDPSPTTGYMVLAAVAVGALLLISLA